MSKLLKCQSYCGRAVVGSTCGRIWSDQPPIDFFLQCGPTQRERAIKNMVSSSADLYEWRHDWHNDIPATFLYPRHLICIPPKHPPPAVCRHLLCKAAKRVQRGNNCQGDKHINIWLVIRWRARAILYIKWVLATIDREQWFKTMKDITDDEVNCTGPEMYRKFNGDFPDRYEGFINPS